MTKFPFEATIEGKRVLVHADRTEPVAEQQLSFETVEVPEHKVRALANVLAGFTWPGRGTFEKLTGPQKRATMDAARAALGTLAEGK